MKCILLLYFVVYAIQLSSGQWTTPKDSEENSKWVWGQRPQDPVTTPTQLPTTETIATSTEVPNDEDNSSTPYDEPIPKIRIGKRISEIKCLEYVWLRKQRAEQAARKKDSKLKMQKGFKTEYILGEHHTVPGEFPSLGAIGWKAAIGTWQFKCGCSLISSKFVLTAAHCSKASSRDTTIVDIVPKVVRLGTTNIDDSYPLQHDEEIINIIVHPNYMSPKQYNDIAVMELGNEVKFSMNMQPACLWTKGFFSLNDMHANVAGWGVVESGSQKTSSELLPIQVDIIDSKECDELLRPRCNRNWCGFQDHQICAGKPSNGVDACQGASGGPLLIKKYLPIKEEGTMHYVVGVTSFGAGCGQPGLPGVYTRVSNFVDWIESIVWPGL